jgi:hypothetical protein
MRNPLSWAFAALAALALVVYLAWEPVPYSTACFQPNREARSFCLTQMWVNSVYNSLASLQLQDADFLEQHRDQIVSDFTQAFMSGMLPDQNLSPLILRHMIDDLIIAKRGQPV